MRTTATINLSATNVEVAAEWYSELFSMDPWFRTPDSGIANYVQFRVGSCPDEFGIIDRRFASPEMFRDVEPAVFWHVDDVIATVNRLVRMGASHRSPIRVRPTGLVTASIIDPFGNVVGIMRDPALTGEVP